ncbi:hypothetical protein N7516_002473 [Penicillium verrucosum]|uniref:uncharacterized protein n=1 Tax=Penicillium verrucosum TaxID=60171 RepID=UPI002545A7CF|nr:uncharacterized protein N7516_002473 [Penicillium verrucosum]KAJ5942305.1 hypothetical protein N7516_002473 [Penicillium verrucosum]
MERIGYLQDSRDSFADGLTYWANFAKTLNPNSGGSYNGSKSLPHWSPNSADGTQVVMELGNQFKNVPIAKPKQVKFIMDYFHQQVPY